MAKPQTGLFFRLNPCILYTAISIIKLRFSSGFKNVQNQTHTLMNYE